MAYATKQNMIDRYGLDELLGLTDRNNTGNVDDDVLTRALENATAEINSEARLTGSVNQTEQLANLCCDITRYRLTDPCPMDGKIRKDYEGAIAFLRRVSSGQALLIGQDASAPAATGNDTPQFVSNDRVFTRTSLENF